MNSVKLTEDKLCVESIYNSVCSPEFGAVSLFVGTTRDNFDGKTVAKLEYEAYEKMAVKSLQGICNNIREKFKVGNIAIYHRLGDVPIQEASVVIAISSTHRESALNAVPYAINALKADVPIWKKEIYGSGESSEWKENSESDDLTSLKSAELSPVHLYEEVVETDYGSEVPSHLIQVRANLQEINRRINSFIYRKRQQINISNIQTFCLENSGNSERSTCARVSAILKRRKDSNSHLKVYRVANTVGPQTHGSDLNFGGPNPDYSDRYEICPPGAEERLANIEDYLNASQHSKNVFARLKAIEDKILYLESISPEYFDFEVGILCILSKGKDSAEMHFQRQDQKRQRGQNFGSLKRTYSSSEINSKMQELEVKLMKKSKLQH